MLLYKTIKDLLLTSGFCLLVSGCGFASLYAVDNKEDVAAHYADIDVPSIPDREGQYLRNALVDELYQPGRTGEARYDLKFTPLVKNIVNSGIQKDATATRAQIQFTTHMQLVDKNTGKPVLERDMKTVGSYNLLDNQLSTLVSQQNIIDSTLREMKDNVMTELALYFRRKASPT